MSVDAGFESTALLARVARDAPLFVSSSTPPPPYFTSLTELVS